MAWGKIERKVYAFRRHKPVTDVLVAQGSYVELWLDSYIWHPDRLASLIESGG